MNDLKARYLAAKRRLFLRYYGYDLNPEQARAVLAERGPVLVLAGAGSGKTTVLVRRIVHLIRFGDAFEHDGVPEHLDEGQVLGMEACAETATKAELEGLLPLFAHEPCPPYGMLAITFTNKAAREIRERLGRALGNPAVSDEIWAGTFHSVSLRILRVHAAEAGYGSGFSIYDSDDQKRVMLDAMRALDIDEKFLPVKSVAQGIGDAKNNLIPPDRFDTHGDYRLEKIGRVYAEYQRRLREANAVDFDDIIMQTVLLLRKHPEIAARYQRKFRYVCIDEYQDTNPAQFALSALLSGGEDNLMVVGDDDQSIYRFRGATVENILGFDKTYKRARIVKLEQNYRSTGRILEAANAIISHNENRHGKRLWCAAGEGEKLTLHKADDQIGESIWIKDKIIELVSGGGRRYRDFAILYRLNEQSRALEATMAKSGIPYRVLGGQRFYDRKEIRDMVAYLHVIANPRDDLRLCRIINEPKRKIGDTTVEAVRLLARAEGVSMSEILARADAYPELAKAKDKLLAFAGMMDELRATALPPDALVRRVFVRTGYEAMLLDEGETGKTRIEHVEELGSAAAEYAKRAGAEVTLPGFLEEIALVSDVDKYDENADAVVLMTIHSAKGLEFPVVFLPGMEEGVFPTSSVNIHPEELAEERRLAYVAVTRAKEKLYLTHTHERMLYGRTTYNPKSRFIAEELPAHLIEETAPRRAARPMRERPALSPEFHRRPPTAQATATPPLVSHAVGARVRHATFGTGTVLTVRPMGADTLYEVRFDGAAGTKKLMATYARLMPE